MGRIVALVIGVVSRLFGVAKKPVDPPVEEWLELPEPEPEPTKPVERPGQDIKSFYEWLGVPAELLDAARAGQTIKLELCVISEKKVNPTTDVRENDERLCAACASLIKAHRQGLVSEGRASQMLGINRLELRWLADAQQAREEQPS
jgi:hypothetical protein